MPRDENETVIKMMEALGCQPALSPFYARGERLSISDYDPPNSKEESKISMLSFLTSTILFLVMVILLLT